MTHWFATMLLSLRYAIREAKKCIISGEYTFNAIQLLAYYKFGIEFFFVYIATQENYFFGVLNQSALKVLR